MNDMSHVIVPKSDQINADDLISGPMTITIAEVQIKGGQEQPVSIYFEGSDKAFRPCKSMSRVLVAAWGPDASKYAGRSLTLYRDPEVKWGGMAVGGIRISHMTDIDGAMTMALTATKGQRRPFVVKPLAAAAAPADKVAAGVSDLLRMIKDAGTPEEVEAIASDPAVIKQRAWLAKNRSAMAAQVDDAFSAARQSGTVDDDPFADRPSPPQAPEASAAGAPQQSAEGEAADTFLEAHNDAATGIIDKVIAAIDAATTASEVSKLVDDHISLLSDDEYTQVMASANARTSRILTETRAKAGAGAK